MKSLQHYLIEDDYGRYWLGESFAQLDSYRDLKLFNARQIMPCSLGPTFAAGIAKDFSCGPVVGLVQIRTFRMAISVARDVAAKIYGAKTAVPNA